MKREKFDFFVSSPMWQLVCEFSFCGSAVYGKLQEKCHRFWLHLRHAVIMISNVRTSASKKIKLMALIGTLTISTTTFERMKEKFYGCRQTE